MAQKDKPDIAAIVTSFAGVETFAGLAHAWHWTVAGGAFNFVLALTSDRHHAVQINTRDVFDASLVRSVLELALKNERAVLAANPLTILEGFHASHSNFETVVAIPPAIHSLYKAKHQELQAVTFWIFPAYRCEFSGRETAQEVVLRTAKMVGPANLKRAPQPVVRLRYVNTRTRGHTLGDKRGLDSVAVLVGELGKLDHAPGSFVEFENYRGDVATVTWEDAFILNTGGTSRRIELEQLLDWVQLFLVGAQEKG